MKIKVNFKYFTNGEIFLWFLSVGVILFFFALFDREGYATLIATLIGVTSLIFSAKGNPVGQLLMVIFSVFYGWISYGFAYYGEMITYLGMTAPMAFFALVAWLKHPYKGDRSVVRINRIKVKEILLMLLLSAVVTVIFYFILEFFCTVNLIPSTVSVTTSFIAVYLTFRRSPFFALAYAANDVILIVLWGMACGEDISYISVVVCFAVFLVNDIYGFLNWRRMEKAQKT